MARGLDQGELMVPPAPRSLSVRAGSCAWWGVDPSTVRVSIATISADGWRGVSTAPFARGLSPGARLGEIFEQTERLARELAQLEPPGIVVVEQPSGRTPNPNLVYAVGATIAALVVGVTAGAGWVHVETVPSRTWKAVACGSGAIVKPRRERGEPAPPREHYAVLRWARENGYRGTSWDEADAWGVAEYARRTWALVAR